MSKVLNSNNISGNKSGDISLDDISKYFDGYINDIDFDNFFFNNNKQNDKKNENKNTIGKNICPECEKDSIVEDHSAGIVVCTNCGTVLDGILDFNPEWKQFEEEDKSQARCGMPINIHLQQSSLGTSIGGMGKNRIKTLHIWNTVPYKERSLSNEFKKIREVCQKAEIYKCIEEDAINMYAKASQCKHSTGKNIGKYIITRGINRISISAGCLFFACIRRGMTRTSKEIALLYGIKDVDMHRGCKNLLKFLKIMKMDIKMGTSKPEHFVKRFCNELKIKNQYIDEAVKIASNLEKLNLASDHTPYSLAAASILLMANIHQINSISKRKLADQFNISDVTISKTLKEIEPYKYVLTDTNATEKLMIKIKKDMDNEKIPSEVLERMKKFGIDTNSQDNSANSQDNLTNSQENIETNKNTEILNKDYYIDDFKKIMKINDKLIKMNECNKTKSSVLTHKN